MRLNNRETARNRIALIFAVLFLMPNALRVVAQSNPPGNLKSYKIEVPGTKEWVDTNIDLRGGTKLRFTATGKITYPAGDQSYESKSRTSGTFGPDGLARGFADLLHGYAVGSAGHGALIGRIGSQDYAQAFLDRCQQRI